MSFLGLKAGGDNDWKLWLGSVKYEHAYVRLDGRGITQANPNGAGTVNCQWVSNENIKAKQFGTWELLEAHGWFEGTTQYIALESIQFPNCYLRLDGRDVNEKNPVGGKANLQHHASPPKKKDLWEVFKIHYDGVDQIPSLESTVFPGVFLRIDAQGFNAPNGMGGGTINGSFGKNEETTLKAVSYI